MSKIPLLLFSGGLDSTFMLQEHLKNSEVDTLYVTATQDPNKVKKELAARQKLIGKLNRISRHQVRQDYVVNLGGAIGGMMPNHKFLQPLMWLTAALMVTEGEWRHSVLRIGYVNGDSIMSHLHDIKQAWHHLQMFTKWNPISVEFPMEFMRKHDILKKLNPLLYKDVWVCETPVKHGRGIKVCNACVPCHTHAAALFMFERNEGKTLQEQHAVISPHYKLPRRKPDQPRRLSSIVIPPPLLAEEGTKS